MMRALVLLAALAAPAAAADWQPLDGAGIRAALAARVLGYPDGGHQNFFADGRTLRESAGGRPSWGRWTVEGDRYCALWPPSDRWTCYRVERHARGLDLRFTPVEGGAPGTGRYIDLG
jgi:hypothetical protein